MRAHVGPRQALSAKHQRWFYDVHVTGEGSGTPTLYCLQFRNHYAAWLTVKLRASGGGADGEDGGEWTTLLRRRQLMVDAHYEDDAQAWHNIYAGEFPAAALVESESSADGADAGATTPPGCPLLPLKAGCTLRLEVANPSPCWRCVELHDVRCFAPPPAHALVLSSAAGAASFSSSPSSAWHDLKRGAGPSGACGIGGVWGGRGRRLLQLLQLQRQHRDLLEGRGGGRIGGDGGRRRGDCGSDAVVATTDTGQGGRLRARRASGPPRPPPGILAAAGDVEPAGAAAAAGAGAGAATSAGQSSAERQAQRARTSLAVTATQVQHLHAAICEQLEHFKL